MPASGRRPASRSRSCSTATARRTGALSPRGGRYFSGEARPGAEGRRPLLVPPRRRSAPAGSGLALSAGGPARPVDGRRSARVRAGPTAAGAASSATARSSTRCTSARSRAEGTWRAAAGELAALADLGITVDRDDAGRRFPRPLRLGLRRRQSLRADAGSTARRTTSARSSTRRTRSASA